MNRPIWAILFVMSVILAVPGCGSDSKSDATAKRDDRLPERTPPRLPAPSGSQPVVHLLSENVDQAVLDGGEVDPAVLRAEQGLEVPAALLDISKSPNSPKLKVIVKGFGSMLQNPRIRQAVATENSLRLSLEMTVQTMAPGRSSDSRHEGARRPRRAARRLGPRQCPVRADG